MINSKKLLLLLVFLYISRFTLADWIKDDVNNIENETIQIRHHIHQNPELGNMEYETSKLVQRELKSYGLEIKKGFAETGVIGILKGDLPGPTMALRADMDALPVQEKTKLSFSSKVKALYQGKEVDVMHACGHDAHTAMLLSTAKILSKNKEKIQGTIIFIFQPAEEGAANKDNFIDGDQVGARKLIKDGALSNPKPEVIFGMHVMSGLPSGNIFYKEGSMMNSSDMLNIQLIGKQAHGSMPWLSQDPIVASAQIINNIQTMVSRRINLTEGMGVISITGIQAGNNIVTIIPEKVTLIGTIRSNNENIRQTILEQLPSMIEQTALANNVKADVKISSYAPVLINDKTLTESMIPSLISVVGKEKVHKMATNSSASEDFAYYGKMMPSLFIFIGATPADQDMEKAAPNHSPYFIVDDSTLKTGVEAHIRFVIDYPKFSEKFK